MPQNAQECLGQYYSVTPNPRLRCKRRATSEFFKSIFTRRNRIQRSQSEYNGEAAHDRPLTSYSQTLLWTRPSSPTVSTQDEERRAPKESPYLAPVPKPWMRSLAPSKPRSSATSSTTSFKSALSRLDVEIPSNASQSMISRYSEQIRQSPFYCCSVEYARRLATASEGRAPLFVISENPTEPIVKPCTAPECPIAAVHNEGPYLYLGNQVAPWLQDELDREFSAGARYIFGHSNPHPLIWIAFWRSSLMNLATKEEHAMVKNFMECHGLLGNGSVNAEQSRAYELCQSLSFGALSPASSTSSPN